MYHELRKLISLCFTESEGDGPDGRRDSKGFTSVMHNTAHTTSVNRNDGVRDKDDAVHVQCTQDWLDTLTRLGDVFTMTSVGGTVRSRLDHAKMVTAAHNLHRDPSGLHNLGQQARKGENRPVPWEPVAHRVSALADPTGLA